MRCDGEFAGVGFGVGVAYVRIIAVGVAVAVAVEKPHTPTLSVLVNTFDEVDDGRARVLLPHPVSPM